MNKNTFLTFKKDTHQYFVDNKEKFSVTKIIDYYLYGENQLLNNPIYKIKTSVLNKKIYLGKCVHLAAELYLKYRYNKNIKAIIINKFLDDLDDNLDKKDDIITRIHLLLDFLIKNKDNFNEVYIEKPLWHDIVAGTPDLIIGFKNSKNIKKYFIIDYKTLFQIDKKTKFKITLQFAGYDFLLRNNNFRTAEIHQVVWIRKKNIKLIDIKLNDEIRQEWLLALNKFKKRGFVNG